MAVPQTKAFDVSNLNGVAFVAVPSMTMFAYVDDPCVIVTPGVVVVSVAEIDVSVAQPLFLSGRSMRTHSFLFTTPLLLPVVASLSTVPLLCRFEEPVMQKFCVVVAPLVA